MPKLRDVALAEVSRAEGRERLDAPTTRLVQKGLGWNRGGIELERVLGLDGHLNFLIHSILILTTGMAVRSHAMTVPQCG